MNKRLFFSVNLSNEIKEKINLSFLKQLEKENKEEKKLKIVKEKNLHLTLRFLGYYPEEKISELIRKTEKVNFERFEIELNKINEFKKRIIWIGISKGFKELQELSNALNDSLGLKKEKIKGHLTIARNKKMNAEEYKELLEKIKKITFKEKFRVENFQLMESILKPEGPEYHVIKSFKLKS